MQPRCVNGGVHRYSMTVFPVTVQRPSSRSPCSDRLPGHRAAAPRVALAIRSAAGMQSGGHRSPSIASCSSPSRLSATSRGPVQLRLRRLATSVTRAHGVPSLDPALAGLEQAVRGSSPESSRIRAF
jgi:hypothetical protein